jgi:hypothetical protein
LIQCSSSLSSLISNFWSVVFYILYRRALGYASRRTQAKLPDVSPIFSFFRRFLLETTLQGADDRTPRVLGDANFVSIV